MARVADDARVLRQVAAAALDPDRPLMAHLIVTRRCNLQCGYCFEYDRHAAPVPRATLEQRLDHLARLRVVFVTLTGGEALLHPDIVALVEGARARGLIPVMNTNGYLLTRERIEALDRAGLFAMQISVDNLEPNRTSAKSLRPLRPKLRLLAAHAGFRVRVNTVLGGGPPDEAVAVARAVLALGFDAKCSLVRDDKGAVRPLDGASRQAYQQIRALGRRAPAYLSEDFQLALAERGQVAWKCRSGARYFMVGEDGRVSLCESSWGTPGIPLEDYTVEHIRHFAAMPKSCAATCAVAYAHQASRVDRLRPQAGPTLSVDKRSWGSEIIPAARLRRRAA